MSSDSKINTTLQQEYIVAIYLAVKLLFSYSVSLLLVPFAGRYLFKIIEMWIDLNIFFKITHYLRYLCTLMVDLCIAKLI